MSLDDHTLLLQLERTYEAVEEKLGHLERDFRESSEYDEDCECDCSYEQIKQIRERIQDLERNLLELTSIVTAHLEAR